MTLAEPPETAIPRVADILPGGAAEDRVTLDHEGRFLRRRRLVSDGGRAFLVDLPRARDLVPGCVLVLSDGTRIVVEAAAEALIEVRGDLARLAWHVGNRHAPCEIGAGVLRVRDDHVMADMLARLGADTRRVTAPFRPEGGAYGHGRTHGHAHGSEQGPDHDHG